MPRAPLSSAVASVLRAPAAVALALAVLASLAPLGARAQVVLKGRGFPVEEGATYVLYTTPDGDVACRLARPGEIVTDGDAETRPPLRQLNHLQDKESATASGAGLTIVLRGTARLDQPENAHVKAAFIAAAAKWEALISNQITVTIDVDYGPDFFGSAYSSSTTLGATSSGGFRIPYANIRQRLINNAPAGSAEATLVNNLPATSTLPTDIGDVPEVFVPTALTRALGYTPPADAPVPRIGFNSNFSFDFDPSNGITSNHTSFDSVAVHEIGHALGFNSQVGSRELDSARPLMATVWDFYRFRPGQGATAFSTAQRVLTSGTTPTDPHVYYSGAAELALSTGKPDGTGGDDEQASHWKDDRLSGAFVGIMDPTLPRGRHEEITANDLRAIDYFGYTLGGTPPPPPPPAPANDNFANAQVISGSSGRVTGTNVGATKEANEPSHSPDGNAGGKSVWFAWTAPSGGNVTFNTGQGAAGEPASSFDTLLAAYSGSLSGGLAAHAKNDDVTLGQITTSSITFLAAPGTTYYIAVDGYDGDTGTIALNWAHTASGGGGGGGPSTVSFSTHAFSASEEAGVALLTVGRSNPAAEARIGVRTLDDPAPVPCSNTSVTVAYARCDYATVIDTITFAAGEAQKTVAIPLIDDAHGEPNETLDVALFNVDSSLQMGVVPITRLTISSGDPQGPAATNPIDGVPFFVRQHYLDFLSREPEAGEPWSAVLNGCADQFNLSPTSASAGCDRLIVSESFFGSPEFALKGGYAFRFYKVSFNRLAEYAEIVSDMRQLTGATPADTISKRAAFANTWHQRTEFLQLYNLMSNAQFVDALMNRYGRQQITTFHPSAPEGPAKVVLSRADLVALLGTFSRGQIVRAIADSDEISAAEFRPTFVAMQYYGYLRRTPEQQGYTNWLNYLNANPNDSRTMVNGFLNSTEYKLRFGKP